MAFTQSDVALLEGQIRTAISDGTWRAKTMQFSDQAVSLVTLKEAQDFLVFMRQDVTSATPNSGRVRFAATSKGI